MRTGSWPAASPSARLHRRTRWNVVSWPMQIVSLSAGPLAMSTPRPMRISWPRRMGVRKPRCAAVHSAHSRRAISANVNA